MTELQVYPIPGGIEPNDHFSVHARRRGDSAWTPVPCYPVRVNMHDVRVASMCHFAFAGAVEVRVTAPLSHVYGAKIRPLREAIHAWTDKNTVTFTLENPCNLSVEINGDRQRNLHLFAGALPTPPRENTLVIAGAGDGPRTTGIDDVRPRLLAMPPGRTLVFAAGLHYIQEYLFPIPSDTCVYLSPGAVVVGAFLCDRVENVRIWGPGIVLQREFHRFSGINGVRISHSRRIAVEDVAFINPPHYTVSLGGSRDVHIRGIKAFSCEGWSDGIDMMSCEDVHIEGCFLRNSDDCIAIYGSRWQYRGNTARVLVENCTLWADVAHPTMIGTHGAHENGGDVIEDITFRGINILQHDEYQPGYLGCLAINAGDGNTVRDVLYEDIQVEHIQHGKLLDFQVVWNRDYNPVPGQAIAGVRLHTIALLADGDVPSVIAGYSAAQRVTDVWIEGMTRQGCPVRTLADANITVGQYADGITIR